MAEPSVSGALASIRAAIEAAREKYAPFWCPSCRKDAHETEPALSFVQALDEAVKALEWAKSYLGPDEQEACNSTLVRIANVLGGEKTLE